MYRIVFIFCFLVNSIGCHAGDVLGIGAPCVDILAHVDDAFINRLKGNKGDSTLVSNQEFNEILNLVSKEKLIWQTGGSCSNTIKGLASLGESTSICGRLGNDTKSHFYLNIIKKFGIKPFFSISDKEIQQALTFVTPDCQRTFFVYLGATEEFEVKDVKSEYFINSKIVYIEGYALHQPAVVKKAIEFAHQEGAKVAFDLASSRVVTAFKEEILSLLEHDIDIVFANQDEIGVLTGLQPREGALFLSTLCPIAVVMVGREGCWIGNEGKVIRCPGYHVDVVDTTGAGDLFAAGFLHGILKNQPLEVCGNWGNLTGSSVVQVLGAEIPKDIWNNLNIIMH